MKAPKTHLFGAIKIHDFFLKNELSQNYTHIPFRLIKRDYEYVLKC